MTDIAFKYTGKDPMQAHHSGIPARDLTQEDYDGLDKDQRAIVRASPIYRKVEAPKEETAKASTKDEPKKADEKKDDAKK